MSETFYIKRGDRKYGIEYTLSTYVQGGAHLAGASAKFQMMDQAGATVISQDAVIHDDDGVLRYSFGAGETDTAGLYSAEFKITFGDGLVATEPNDGFFTVKIGADVPDS